ncbi:LysR family transcriptional regulator [Geomonas sp. Red276]
METRALRAFVEVVRQGGFSRAAKTVFVTQSTVSKAVKQLEEQLGFQLLERIGHQSKLTAAGEIVYRRGAAILAQGEDLRTELEELRGLKGGVLRLGVPLIGSNTLFARWFATYRSLYPEVELRLVEHGSKRLEELVLAGELDLAASLLPVGEEFAWQELRREPIDLLLSADHPLARRDKLSFKDLAEEPFILYGTGFALNPIIMEACRTSGFTPKIAAQSTQVDFIIELVAANVGVALLPRMIIEQRPHLSTRRLPIDHPSIYWHMALIWRRAGYLSHAAQAWLALAGKPG